MISAAFARTLIGFASSALGCLCGSLGDVFIRHSFINVDEQLKIVEENGTPPVLDEHIDQTGSFVASPSLQWLRYRLVRQKLPAKLRLSPIQIWLLGMFFACVGNPLLILTGLALAPALLVISLSAFSLAASVSFASLINGEELTVGTIVGCCLIVAGLLGMLISFWVGAANVPAYVAASSALTTGTGVAYVGIVSGVTALAVWAATSSGQANGVYRTFGKKIGPVATPYGSDVCVVTAPVEAELHRLPEGAAEESAMLTPVMAARYIPVVTPDCGQLVSQPVGRSTGFSMKVPNRDPALFAKAAAAISAGIASGHAELGGKALTSVLEARTFSLPADLSLFSSIKYIFLDHHVIITAFVLAFILLLDVVLLNLCLRKGEAVIVVPMRNATNMICGTLGGMLILGEIPDYPLLLTVSFFTLLFGTMVVPYSQTRRP